MRIPRPRPTASMVFRAALLGALHLAGVAADAAADDAPGPRADFTLRLREVRLDADGAEARTETRLRAEARVRAEVSSGIQAVLAFGTTREGEPAAAEATLGDRLGDLPVGVRAAALVWRPEGIPGWTLLAGKLEPPFLLVSDLIWDRDVRPEGAAARWTRAAGAFDLIALGGAFALRDDDDLDGGARARLYAAQAALRHRWPDRSWAILGAGYYPAEGSAPPAPGEARPADAYRPAEVFAAGTWELYFPVRAVAHGAWNTEAEAEREGWLAELTIGRARAVHGMEIGLQWRRLEKNAALAAFADNELWPGTARAERRLRLAYRPAPGVLLSLIWSEGRRIGGGAADGLRGATVEALVEF